MNYGGYEDDPNYVEYIDLLRDTRDEAITSKVSHILVDSFERNISTILDGGSGVEDAFNSWDNAITNIASNTDYAMGLFMDLTNRYRQFDQRFNNDYDPNHHYILDELSNVVDKSIDLERIATDRADWDRVFVEGGSEQNISRKAQEFLDAVEDVNVALGKLREEVETHLTFLGSLNP